MRFDTLLYKQTEELEEDEEEEKHTVQLEQNK